MTDLVGNSVIRHTAKNVQPGEFPGQMITVNPEPPKQNLCETKKQTWFEESRHAVPLPTKLIGTHACAQEFGLTACFNPCTSPWDYQHDYNWTLNRSRNVPQYTATRRNEMCAVNVEFCCCSGTQDNLYFKFLAHHIWSFTDTYSWHHHQQTPLLTKSGLACGENEKLLSHNPRPIRPQDQPNW